MTIKWAKKWKDKGAIRRFDDKKNYPLAESKVIVDKQMMLALGHDTVESVREYKLYVRPDGTKLPDGLLFNDTYYTYYAKEKDAIAIVELILWTEGKLNKESMTPYGKSKTKVGFFVWLWRKILSLFGKKN